MYSDHESWGLIKNKGTVSNHMTKGDLCIITDIMNTALWNKLFWLVSHGSQWSDILLSSCVSFMKMSAEDSVLILLCVLLAIKTSSDIYNFFFLHSFLHSNWFFLVEVLS